MGLNPSTSRHGAWGRAPPALRQSQGHAHAACCVRRAHMQCAHRQCRPQARKRAEALACRLRCAACTAARWPRAPTQRAWCPRGGAVPGQPKGLIPTCGMFPLRHQGTSGTCQRQRMIPHMCTARRQVHVAVAAMLTVRIITHEA